MRILVNHDACQHAGEYSDRCLSATVRNPWGHEAFCMAQVEEDGREELTVVLTSGGQSVTRVFRTQAEREIAAAEGWLAFVDSKSSAPALQQD